MLGDPLDERVERLDVRDVFAAQSGEASPKVLVEPNAVRGKPVAQLSRKAPAADIPVRQYDRFAVACGDLLTQSEYRRPFVDQADVARDPEGA